MAVTHSPGTVVLTGATGSLGRALLEPISRARPQHLILIGRAPVALHDAARRARDAGARLVSVVEADLADLAEVAAAGRHINELVGAGHPPLTHLLLNAGLQMADRSHRSAQGLELTFAVNVVAQHLLLAATGAATADGAHAVLVGSGTHYGDWHSYGSVPAPRWQDPNLLTQPDGQVTKPDRNAGGRAYATSKLAVVYLAHAWQSRHAGRRFNVFDPGLMPGTGLARQLTGPQLFAWNHVMPALTFLPGWSTPSRSAAYLAAFAVGQTHAELTGGYVELGKARRSSDASYDPAREQQLWQVLESLVAPYRPGRTGDTGT